MRQRGLPLRAMGLLAICAILVLIAALVGSALVFRALVQDHLSAIEIALRLGLYTHPDVTAHLGRAREYMDGGTLLLIWMGWLGITLVSTAGLMFFWRLAADIAAVRARAQAIVTGERGRGQPLGRHDELGDLGRAVDDLAEALVRRERALEIERRHVMHQEKLATIGSMAAGVLREIGNPVAAIDGYARALVDAQREGQVSQPGAWYDPAALLAEARRLVDITREIAMLAAAPATQRELVSLNDVVSRSTALLRYEPRLEGVAVVLALDAQLPAISGIGDRLVLLVSNLVVNAADATATRPAHTARIEIATRRSGGGVELCVADNGCGMDAAVRQRAFEPLFTTKPPGHGTGLGLPLCRSIAEDHGGRIALDSQPGHGTRVTVWLPLAE
ncbi:MAG: hypothetical protein HY854_02695 [Burkholderiales bacterium]|nr:hypothetical protein [Burkholderiales bacterium]